MLKGGIFSLGLASGVYLGIYLRDSGFTAAIIRAYQAFNYDALSKQSMNSKKLSFEEIYEYYQAGLLDEKNMNNFKQMLSDKRFDKIDEISVNELSSILDQADIDELRRKINSNIYKK